MGEAIFKRWELNKINPKKVITVVEKNTKRRNILEKKYPKLKICKELPLLWKGDLVVLAIKPQTFFDIAKELNSKKTDTKIILSIMAGITLSSLKKFILINSFFIRAMPNLASSTGKGVTGVFTSDTITLSYKKKIDKLLSALGWVYWLKSEKFFNPLTAISGSGPAYIFLFCKK